jgi:opacity protein-like surface antigen
MTVPTTTLRSNGRSITRRYAARVRTLTAPAIAALALAASAASSATAASGPTIDRNPLLWATVNVCDTTKHPDVIGIHASMPGAGNPAEKMYMRFAVEYLKPATNKWEKLGPSTDSGFHYVGSAKYVRRVSGWNFSMTPPPSGQTYRLRGVVTFQWRLNGKVSRSAVKRTKSGHAGTNGADPKGYSAAECIIKP